MKRAITSYRFTSEAAFITAGQDLLRDVWRGFVSAVLPDVTEIKDVRALRAIIAASPAGAASGSSSITKTLDRLTVLRGPGESYSDVILRPAKASS